MTPTEKQKCIAEQWLYGLKVHGMGCFDPDAEETFVMKIVDMDVMDNALRVIIIPHNDSYDYDNEDSSYLSVEDEISPILRPMSDLTKKITHKGYNDDKPFVPLVELAKVAQNATKTDHLQLIHDTVVDFTIAYHFKQNVMWFQSLQGKKQVYILPNQNRFFDLLHLWHFDTHNLIATGQAIDANTLPENPYKV